MAQSERGGAGIGAAERPTIAIGTDAGCEHPGLRQIGSDAGGNLYLQCPRCEGVIVRSGPPGRTWRPEDVDRSVATDAISRALRTANPDGSGRTAGGATLGERLRDLRNRVLGN